MYYLTEVANTNQIGYTNQFFSKSCHLTPLKKLVLVLVSISTSYSIYNYKY